MPSTTPLKAIILAAGKGTRLYPVTQHIPKPLLPLANRLTLEYAFDQLRALGVREACVIVGENEPALRAALGEGGAFGLALSYARQNEPKGLAHAMACGREFVGDAPFVLYLGDAVYGGSFEKHAARFMNTNCANLNIVQPVADPRSFGVANVDGERIVKLVEKPANPESNLAMAGTYFFRSQIWEVLPDLQPSARGEYEITDAIQMLIDRGETVLAGEYTDAWFDTGTLPSFLATSRYLTNGRSLIAEGSEVQNPGSHVVVGPDVVVRCESIEDSVVLPGARVEAEGPIRGSLIGGSVRAADLVDQIAWNDERR